MFFPLGPLRAAGLGLVVVAAWAFHSIVRVGILLVAVTVETAIGLYQDDRARKRVRDHEATLRYLD